LALRNGAREGGIVKVLVAPDKFKGSLSARRVAEAVAAGLTEGWPELEVLLHPLADGGDGTMEVLVEATSGKTVPFQVTGPLGEPVTALLGVLGDGRTAVVEMAQASGLQLVPPGRRDPLRATTRGTGELISHALDLGFRDIIVAVGGSATNDGGTGMARALGVRFLDGAGNELLDGAAPLLELEHIDTSGIDPRVGEARITVACDVANPLLGETGASAVYAPQKGAGPREVELLEEAMARLAQITARDVVPGVEEKPGSGAAGGLGFGLMAFLGAETTPGARLVMELTGFFRHLEGADLVITGEGKLDEQTGFGKTVVTVVEEAGKRGIPVIALAGMVTEGAFSLRERGLTAAFSIAPGPCSLEECVARSAEFLGRTAREIALLLRNLSRRFR